MSIESTFVLLGQVTLIAAAAPIARAWWVNRHTALMHALGWGIAAWLAWITAGFVATVQARYIALVLTGCAGVAVLGARRPGAAAWNGVIAGLLAVLMLPMGQGFLAGTELAIDSMRALFLGAALAVGLVNFVPTRLGLGAAALFAACFLELYDLATETPINQRAAVLLLAGIAPWLAWMGQRFGHSVSEDDRLWRDFRDRFGIVWGQRLREQFNTASRHANLSVELRWSGLRRLDGTAADGPASAASRQLLRALMTRFGLP